MMRHLFLISLLCSYTHGLSSMTRRTAVWGMVGATAVPAAHAYERRDVGGENRSPEQAAYNLQAYETNNRLEQQGLKLETQAEQKASLSAALADYSYTPSTNNGNKKKDNGGKTKK